jgi:hypothetical protein
MKRLIVAAAAVAVLTTGCAANSPSQVSKAAASALKQPVADLRVAANGTSITAVQEKEQALINVVDQLVQSNDLGAKRGQSIANAAAALLNDFRRRNTPTSTPTPTDTPTETPTDTPTSAIPTITITQTPTETPVTPTDTATPPEKSKKPKKPKPLHGFPH